MKHLDEFTHLDLNAGQILRREQQEPERSPMTLQAETDYDLASADIRCNADKFGAQVFLVEFPSPGKKPWRVLAFNEREAESIFDEYHGFDIDPDEEDEDES